MSMVLPLEQWWPRVVATAATAQSQHALVPIPTYVEHCVDQSLPFVVRVVDQLRRKDEAQRSVAPANASRSPSFNPFLPHDPALYIADASEEHLCLLNKFNVVDHHVLIVTRDFHSQDEPLTVADFAAADYCLRACDQAGLDGLAFYNGGRDAGASQPHKHLQILPLRKGTASERLPIEQWLELDAQVATARRFSSLPFAHRIDWSGGSDVLELVAAPEQLAAWYRNALHDFRRDLGWTESTSPLPYNMLWTRRWVLLVPRAAEQCEGISLNSLAFAGGLFVRSAEQLERIRQIGPIFLLSRVTFPVSHR